MDQKLKILFLCTGNSCRSQMAEGWARELKTDQVEAFSAGIEKHGLNPLAVKAMAEAGVDISSGVSKTVDEFLRRPLIMSSPSAVTPMKPALFFLEKKNGCMWALTIHPPWRKIPEARKRRWCITEGSGMTFGDSWHPCRIT